MLERTYLPVLLLMGFVILNAVAILALSALVTRWRPNPEKLEAYESGMPPIGDARERFSVKFYMVAMLFIVFDIETVFMIPWGVLYRELSCAPGMFDPVTRICPAGQVSVFGLVEMLVFIGILLVGLVYVWKKGALQWD